MVKVGIVAGESSGDILGSRLMHALKQALPEIEFHGIGGEHMQQEGLTALEEMEHLVVNGFIGPLLRLPSFIKLLDRLALQMQEMDVFVGVDFNVFNLALEKRLKKLGVPTVHYVSPSVYAWRKGRAWKMEKSTDVLLTLFPFEPKYYEETNVRAEFVGHPLADEIQPVQNLTEMRKTARAKLGLDSHAVVVALLPGSRHSEIQFHARLFLESCQRFQSLAESKKRYQFVIPCGREKSINFILREMLHFPDIEVHITEADSKLTLSAADVALVKSGTSTLESLLLRVPIVVTYRIGWLTFAIVRTLLHTRWVALPNIVANRRVVPEYLQSQATAETLARTMLSQLQSVQNNDILYKEYAEIHESLRHSASERSAEVIVELLNRRGQTQC